MSPAGDSTSLAAALRAGADSVYFGVGKLNMRAGASANFAEKDVPAVARKCHVAGAKCYLALNTVVFDDELDAVRRLCAAASEAGVDAVVAGDPAVFRTARAVGLPVHVSVQANAANLETVRSHAEFADAVVLARELSLDRIRAIVDGIAAENIVGPSGELVKVEVFVHGALCVSVSGLCHMSLATENASGNRGECRQTCRRRYRVVDEETGSELLIDNHHVMSPKDICCVGALDEIAAAGVSILKIEGRGRSADYVDAVTRVYREALDACLDGTFSVERALEWERRLEKTFNRGFWKGGYYLGEPVEAWAAASGNRSGKRKTHIGKITNYFAKIGVAEITLDAGGLKRDDEFVVVGPTTGALTAEAGNILLDGVDVPEAYKGDVISVEIPRKARRNDKVYRLDDRSQISPRS
jgi:putative protease